jgi:Ca2+/Na+ antiporter
VRLSKIFYFILNKCYNYQLKGAGIFITCLVFGSILITTDFKMMERPLIRDLSFYMISAFIVWYIFYNGKIRMWHAIGVMCLYAAYVVVVIVSGIIYKRMNGEVPEERKLDNLEFIIRVKTFLGN